MNYTECFNRSRVDGLQLVCSPFFCRPAASMVPGVEYCRRATFAPLLLPRWCQAWSIATVPPLRPPCCLDGARRGVLPPCHLCAPSCCLEGARRGVLPRLHICALPAAHSITLHTFYNITDIRDFAAVPNRYRSYRASQRLEICKQM